MIGAVFTALASVTDDLLRAHGHPGFVCITQGVGGCITIIGTALLDGRPLAAVALVSSSGFVVTFVLAWARLRAATRRLNRHGRARLHRDPPAARSRRPSPVMPRIDLESKGRHRKTDVPGGTGKHRRTASRRYPSVLRT
jgi:hypothetical protein